MKIVKLESSNIKKLKAVQIEPSGNVVVVGGANGAGKSSVLDSIAYCLAGKNRIDAQPIRSGESKAEIVVETETLVVRRSFSKSGTRLEVKSKDGAKFPSPQAMLDELCGELTFDPLAFARMPSKAQAETLRRLTGLDFAELDGQRAKLFEERTLANRDLKRVEAALTEAPHHDDVPAEELSLEDLSKELKRRQEHNTANRRQRQSFEQLRGLVTNRKRDLAHIEDKINDLKRQLEALEADRARHQKNIDEVNEQGRSKAAEVKGLVDLDEWEVNQKIVDVGTINAKVRANLRRAELQKERDQHAAESQRLSNAITAIDQQKAEQLAAAKLPVPGLAFDDDGVTLAGVPFSQASSAEQLRTSVALGISAHPKLRVLLIKDGSLLDAESLKLIAEMAAASDCQLWIERVGDGSEVSVLIEDGNVVVDRPGGTAQQPPPAEAPPDLMDTSSDSAEW